MQFSTPPTTMTSQQSDTYSLADATEAIAHFRALIETRSFKKEQLQEKRIVADLRRLEWAASDGPAQIRLEALSVLGKAAEVSVPIAAAVKPVITKALSNRPPHTDDWGNADDRYYLAKAISACSYGWIGVYAARELALAGTSEVRSREVWADLALTNCDSIAEAISEIAAGLNDFQRAGSEDQLILFRRLNRVCESLLKPLLFSELPAGSDVGATLRSLINLSAGSSTSEFTRVREATATSAMDVVITILRLRFDTLFDRDIYRAVSAPLTWWRPAKPPQSVEDRLNRAANLGVDALLVVARQGLKDVELRRSISSALGSDRIDRIASHKANSDPSLPPDISYWLSTGRALQAAAKNETLEEVLDQDMDELIARMAIEKKRFEMMPSDIRQIGDEIEAFEPAHGSSIKALSTYLDLVGQSIDAISRKRGIVVSPERDDTVKYDPRLHETSRPMATSTEARIVIPGAVKTVAGRPPVIVVKAIVK